MAECGGNKEIAFDDSAVDFNEARAVQRLFGEIAEALKAQGLDCKPKTCPSGNACVLDIDAPTTAQIVITGATIPLSDGTDFMGFKASFKGTAKGHCTCRKIVPKPQRL
ncbi:MAG: hypothetical protein JOZ86_14640 [Candidatus Eremiobacteraeota bacterium]|nr:hypothetical protein [Candidatus Eremiobacteraeota bacterium]